MKLYQLKGVLHWCKILSAWTIQLKGSFIIIPNFGEVVPPNYTSVVEALCLDQHYDLKPA